MSQKQNRKINIEFSMTGQFVSSESWAIIREMFKFYSSRILSLFCSSTPTLRWFRCREEENAIDPMVAFDVAPLSLVEVISSTDLLPVDQLGCRPVELSSHLFFLVLNDISYRYAWIVYA